MNSNRLLEQLRDLEIELHQPELRSNPTRLETLLHESFFEFGRSGRSYDKTEIIELLSKEYSPDLIWSQEFSVAEIAEGVALLTYRSAHIDDNGELTQHSNRSSLWQHTNHGWQMRFHQGTAIDEFVAHAS